MDPTFSYTSKDTLFSGALSPKLDRWSLGTISGDVYMFQKGIEEPQKITFSSGSVRSIEYDSKGENLISGDKSGNIFLTNIETLDNSVSIKRAHHDSIECIRFLSESVIVSGDTGGYLKIWDLRTTKATQTYRYEQDYISDIAVVNETSFVSTNGIGCANVIDSRSAKRKQYYVQEDDDFTTVAYMKFLNYAVIGSSKPKIYVTRYPSLDYICESPGNSKSPIVVMRSFDTERNRAVIAQDDGSVCILEISPNKSVVAFKAHKSDIIGGCLQGTTFMTWGNDSMAKIWDLSELSKMQIEKDKSKRKKGKKFKNMGVKVRDHQDNFFSNY
ncbi:hypothetical protein TRFO_24621 [Tritrichomonas foetus]|uniref:Uncharacterized protein n=1 Tax=Tritrichomonas foetus TaxID=1144522 RepID=A0A1J4K738_9EUKA|nr:hypothetical protein TRFO_24621 [Tritrichomonas foetus]|eukprot:OHT07281.1 hypothetical protein TRFO_24621 [Tritrichomonas foetus]